MIDLRKNYIKYGGKELTFISMTIKEAAKMVGTLMAEQVFLKKFNSLYELLQIKIQ